jgi:hypothetical protein
MKDNVKKKHLKIYLNILHYQVNVNYIVDITSKIVANILINIFMCIFISIFNIFNIYKYLIFKM